jgi:hypothetical protein
MFKTILKRLAKRVTLIAGVAFLCAAIIAPETLTAFALDATTTEVGDGIIAVQNVLNVVLWPVLMIIGALLDNTMLFGSGMEERIREIWIPIRNMVNIFFVLALVGVALYNVLGLGEKDGQASLKSILPKIIVGLILVNFSFFAIKLTLDATNVVTTAIFAIPTQITGDVDMSEELEKELCEKETGFTKNSCDVGTGMLNPQGKKFLSKWGSHNAALLLAIKTGKVVFYGDVEVNVENWENLSISIIISMLMYLMFGLAFLALLAILAIRMVVLWVVIALSPILILAIAAPDLRSKIPALGELVEGFTKILIAPITIALTLSVGWIMLDAFEGVQSLNVTSGELAGLLTLDESGIPVAGLSTIQSLMAAIGTIAVIWAGVFGAASDTYAGGIVDMLGAGAKGAAKWAVWTPIKHIPIAPGLNIEGVAEKFINIGKGNEKKLNKKELRKKLGERGTLSESHITQTIDELWGEEGKMEELAQRVQDDETKRRYSRSEKSKLVKALKTGTKKEAMSAVGGGKKVLVKSQPDEKTPVGKSAPDVKPSKKALTSGPEAIKKAAQKVKDDGGADNAIEQISKNDFRPDKGKAIAALTAIKTQMVVGEPNALKDTDDIKEGLKGLENGGKIFDNLLESFKLGNVSKEDAEKEMLEILKKN